MPAGIIIAALIAVGGTIASTTITSSDNENARNEARGLSRTKRQDDLNWQKSQDRLNTLILAQRKREGRAKERAQRAQLKQREKEFAFQESESFFGKQMGMLNSSEVMRNNFANNLFRKAA